MMGEVAVEEEEALQEVVVDLGTGEVEEEVVAEVVVVDSGVDSARVGVAQEEDFEDVVHERRTNKGVLESKVYQLMDSPDVLQVSKPYPRYQETTYLNMRPQNETSVYVPVNE